MAFRIANLVTLQRAVLCANCEIVSEGLNGRCDACGGESLLHLKAILGETVETAAQVDLVDFFLVDDEPVGSSELVSATP
jgi:hypothetical protein